MFDCVRQVGTQRCGAVNAHRHSCLLGMMIFIRFATHAMGCDNRVDEELYYNATTTIFRAGVCQ